MIRLPTACLDLAAQMRATLDASRKTDEPWGSIEFRRVAALPHHWIYSRGADTGGATGHGKMAFETAKKALVARATDFFNALTDPKGSPFAVIRSRVCVDASGEVSVQVWADGFEISAKDADFPQRFATVCQKMTALGGAKTGGASPAYLVRTAGGSMTGKSIFVRADNPSRAALAAMGLAPYIGGSTVSERRDIDSVRLIAPDPFRLHAEALAAVHGVTNSAEMWGQLGTLALAEAFPKETVAPTPRKRRAAAAATPAA